MNNMNDNKDKRKKAEQHLLGFIDGAKNAEPLVQNIILCCAIDAAANYWYGKKSADCAGIVFKLFVKFYLPRYEDLSNAIYNGLRCSLVHSFTLGKHLALTSGNSDLHLCCYDNMSNMIVGNESVGALRIINLENFRDDVKNAIETLFQDAENGEAAPVFKELDNVCAFKSKTVKLLNDADVKLISEYKALDITPSECQKIINEIWGRTDLAKKKNNLFSAETNDGTSKKLWQNIDAGVKELKLLTIIAEKENIGSGERVMPDVDTFMQSNALTGTNSY